MTHHSPMPGPTPAPTPSLEQDDRIRTLLARHETLSNLRYSDTYGCHDAERIRTEQELAALGCPAFGCA